MALGREVRRGRANHRRAEKLVEELLRLCGGLPVLTQKWGDFLEELLAGEPGSARTLRALMAVTEVVRLSQSQMASAASPARSQANQHDVS